MAAEPNAPTTWPTLAQVAERLGVSPSRVRQIVVEGALETARIGPLHVVNPASLAAYEQHRSTLTRDTMGRVIDGRARRRKGAADAAD